MKSQGTPRHTAWTGFAFEQVCLAHIPQIKECLKIQGILAHACSWKSGDEGQGAQVDLLLDRSDDLVDLCETKYSMGEFVIDKDVDMELRNKLDAFKRVCPKNMAARIVIITTFGVKQNKYSDAWPIRITAEDLFT